MLWFTASASSLWWWHNGDDVVAEIRECCRWCGAGPFPPATMRAHKRECAKTAGFAPPGSFARLAGASVSSTYVPLRAVAGVGLTAEQTAALSNSMANSSLAMAATMMSNPLRGKATRPNTSWGSNNFGSPGSAASLDSSAMMNSSLHDSIAGAGAAVPLHPLVASSMTLGSSFASPSSRPHSPSQRSPPHNRAVAAPNAGTVERRLAFPSKDEVVATTTKHIHRRQLSRGSPPVSPGASTTAPDTPTARDTPDSAAGSAYSQHTPVGDASGSGVTAPATAFRAAAPPSTIVPKLRPVAPPTPPPERLRGQGPGLANMKRLTAARIPRHFRVEPVLQNDLNSGFLFDSNTVDALNDGHSLFSFCCRKHAALSDAELAIVETTTNLTGFPEGEALGAGAPVLDLRNPKVTERLTHVIVKTAFLIPGFDHRKLTVDTFASVEYQKFCQPGTPTFEPVTDPHTFRFKKPIIRFILSATVQMRCWEYSDDAALWGYLHHDGVVPEKIFLVERTKRDKSTPDTVKIKTLLMYYPVDQGTLVTNVTLVVNDGMPAFVSKIINSFQKSGMGEAGLTTENTREFCATRYGDDRPSPPPAGEPRKKK